MKYALLAVYIWAAIFTAEAWDRHERLQNRPSDWAVTVFLGTVWPLTLAAMATSDEVMK